MKPTPAQQHVLSAMQQGFELSAYRSLISGEETYRSASLFKPYAQQRKRVSVRTIDALLKQQQITERCRYLTDSGTWQGQPHEAWTVEYQIVKNEETDLSF